MNLGIRGSRQGSSHYRRPGAAGIAIGRPGPAVPQDQVPVVSPPPFARAIGLSLTNESGWEAVWMRGFRSPSSRNFRRWPPSRFSRARHRRCRGCCRGRPRTSIRRGGSGRSRSPSPPSSPPRTTELGDPSEPGERQILRRQNDAGRPGGNNCRAVSEGLQQVRATGFGAAFHLAVVGTLDMEAAEEHFPALGEPKHTGLQRTPPSVPLPGSLAGRQVGKRSLRLAAALRRERCTHISESDSRGKVPLRVTRRAIHDRPEMHRGRTNGLRSFS